MSSEVLYTKVMPKERVNFIPEASDTGDSVIYAEVDTKLRSDQPDSTPQTTHSETCWVNSPWCCVTLALLFCAVLLLLAVILLAVRCYSR